MTIKPYKIKIGDHEELVNATDGTHAGRIASDMLVRERWKDAHQDTPIHRKWASRPWISKDHRRSKAQEMTRTLKRLSGGGLCHLQECFLQSHQ